MSRPIRLFNDDHQFRGACTQPTKALNNLEGEMKPSGQVFNPRTENLVSKENGGFASSQGRQIALEHICVPSSNTSSKQFRTIMQTIAEGWNHGAPSLLPRALRRTLFIRHHRRPATIVVWRQMIDAVNRGCGPGEQFSKWWHTPITLQTVWPTYRTMHPESSLPLAYLLSAAGIVVCVLVFGLAESAGCTKRKGQCIMSAMGN
jgi:hypothetical protein